MVCIQGCPAGNKGQDEMQRVVSESIITDAIAQYSRPESPDRSLAATDVQPPFTLVTMPVTTRYNLIFFYQKLGLGVYPLKFQNSQPAEDGS